MLGVANVGASDLREPRLVLRHLGRGHAWVMSGQDTRFTIAMWIRPDAVTSRGIFSMAEAVGVNKQDRNFYFNSNSKIVATWSSSSVR